MRFYKGQSGPIMDGKAYAAALREMSKRPGLCAASSHTISEVNVHDAIAKLSDQALITSTQIAAQLSQADEAFAEYWFLRQLGFSD